MLVRWAMVVPDPRSRDAPDHRRPAAPADRGARAAGHRAVGGGGSCSGRGGGRYRQKVDHLAGIPPAAHRLERVLEVVEADPAVDQAARPAVGPRASTPRSATKSTAGSAEPVVRAEDPPRAVDERVDLERRPLAERGHADQHGRPADRQRPRSRARPSTPADRLEHEVRAAVGQVAQRGEHRRRHRSSASSVSVAPTSRATSSLAATRSIATIRDAPATAAPITHDSPTPPRPITATDDPAGTVGGLEHRADTGRHAAADERGHGRVDAVGERDGRRGRHDRRLGHRGDRAVRPDATERGLAVEQRVPVRRGVGTRPHRAPPARPAAPARDQPGQRDELADTGRGHTRPDGLDNASALVAQDDRGRAIPLAVADVQVGMAHAGGQHPHPDLAGTWLDELELADLDRTPDRLEHRGAYGGRHVSADRRRSTGRAGTYGT